MTSLEWWKSRPQGFSVALPDFPTLDEAWLWFLVEREPAGEPLGESLSAMCVEAEDVWQDRWPDRVASEFAFQSVYLALAQAHLVGGNREKFQEEARALFELVVDHLEKSASLIDDAFLEAAPAMQRYLCQLREARGLFAEDLERARMLGVSLPPEASPSGAWRSMRLPVLDRPSSTQIKLWARRDFDCAPLVVRQKDGLIGLSADPTREVKLGQGGARGAGVEWARRTPVAPSGTRGESCHRPLRARRGERRRADPRQPEAGGRQVPRTHQCRRDDWLPLRRPGSWRRREGRPQGLGRA
jgi:hypothetical protein